MKEKLITNKKINVFIISLFIYVTLCFQDLLVPYNILSIFLFIIIYYAIYKTNLNHIYKKEFSIISLVLSILLVLGRVLYNLRYDSVTNSLNEFISIKSLIFIIGISSLIYVIFSIVLTRMIKYKSNTSNNINNVFMISFIIMFAVYLVYYLIYFPGILTGDSIDEINMILGNVTLNDHHTIFHIIFLYIPFKLTSIFTNNINICVGVTTLTQIIIMSLILAYSINYLYKRNTPKYILIGIITYYALLPINGFYSITLWKDIIFSLLIVLLTIECQKLIEKKNNITIKNSYTFIIISILAILSRNNAIYMYIILALLTIIIFRKRIITVLLMFIIIFSTYYTIKGPLYNYFNIEKSSSSEYIAIPLQQIGRMAYKNVKFTKYEETEINKVIPVSRLKELYSPEIVDPIKFDKEYNSKAFEKNKLKYLKLWLGLCIKHPAIAVESYLTSTLGYWYPGVEYWVTIDIIDENNLGIKNTSIVPKSIRNRFSKIRNSNIPLIGFTRCIGFCIWIIFTLLYVAIKRNRKEVLYSFIPVVGIWITLLIATPVIAEFRYIYCAYLCLPVFIGLIYSK